jgi:hypothetical protein
VSLMYEDMSKDDEEGQTQSTTTSPADARYVM